MDDRLAAVPSLPSSSAATRIRLACRLAGLALGATLAGCVVAPAQPVYTDGGVVTVAPPPPQAEIVGVAPAPGYIWINGYWGWNGGRHVWTPGRWSAPRPGYRWVPHSWARDGRGWRQAPGHWQR